MSRFPNVAFTLATGLVLFASEQRNAIAGPAILAADIIIDGQLINVTGDNTSGVNVPGSTLLVEINNSTITTNGALSHGGVLSGVNSTLQVAGSSFLTLGDASHGLSFAGGTNVGEMTDSQLSTQGDSAFALHVESGGQVRLDNVTLTSAGGFSSAINLLHDSALVARNSAIETTGGDAHGLYLRGVDTSQRAVAEFVDGAILTRGDNAIAVNVNGNATATLRDTQIRTTGANAYGVWVPEADSQLVANSVDIETQGDNAIGVFTQLGGQANLNGGRIQTSGDQAHALYAGNASAIDAQNLSVQVGSNSVGAFAAGGSQIRLSNIDLRSAESATGLAAYAGSTVGMNSGQVLMTGAGAKALYANNGGTLSLDNVVVSADGAASIGLHSAAAAGTRNNVDLQGSLISAAAGQAISVQGGSLALDLADSHISGANLLTVDAGTEDVMLRASRSMLAGSIQSDGLNTQLFLEDNSTLSGAVSGLSTLALDRSLWEMTGSSRIGELNMTDGQVSFAASPFSTLTIDGDLTGSGTFLMSSDLFSLRGDLIEVGGRVEGSHTLVVADSGVEPAVAGGRLMVVDGNGGSGSFDLYGGHVDAGAFRYTLEADGDDWFLMHTSMASIGISGAESLSKGANAAVASHIATATLWNSQMSALVKRMGELRMGKDDGGVWSRAIGHRYNIAEGSSRAFSQSVSGVEVGADKAIPFNGGKVYMGAMVGSAKSDQSFGEGASGEIDSKMAGVYATYLDDSGVYVDSVIKYSRFENEVKNPTNVGTTVKGTYSNNGFGAEVEVGKKIALTDGWFVEPKLAVSATRTEGGKYTSNDGLRVSGDNMNSLQGTLGAMISRSMAFDNGLKAQPYVKTAYINEFSGKSHVNVNDNRLKANLPGDRVALGFGGILQLSENSKVSLDAEYAKGNDIEQLWGVTVGYRYTW